LSVRKTEELVRQMQVEKLKDPSKATKKKQLNQDFEELSGHLSEVFKSEVVFRINNKGKGKIVIPFEDSEDMERILGMLDRLNS
jgi:ParB family chromosome partitioning protein